MIRAVTRRASGSVLGSILFNIYLNDLFYLTEMTQVFNFADDTTFYVCDKYLNTLINRLEHYTTLAIDRFEKNFKKLNQDKCHLPVSGHKHETVWAKIGETKILESNKQKLIGFAFDRNLNFDEYVFDLCKKGGLTFHSLLTTRCKFTCCSLLVVNSLVTHCEIRLLLVAEVARCKESLVTRWKICSILILEAAHRKKFFSTHCKNYSLQKNHLPRVAEFKKLFQVNALR